MTADTAPDFTRTRLNTLACLIGKQLSELQAYIDANQVMAAPCRVFIGNRLFTLGHLIAMAEEISDALEPALRDIARTVQRLVDTGCMDQACADDIFASYNTHLGDMAADQLFADALGT